LRGSQLLLARELHKWFRREDAHQPEVAAQVGSGMFAGGGQMISPEERDDIAICLQALHERSPSYWALLLFLLALHHNTGYEDIKLFSPFADDRLLFIGEAKGVRFVCHEPGGRVYEREFDVVESPRPGWWTVSLAGEHQQVRYHEVLPIET